jgi:hypothetical protein
MSKERATIDYLKRCQLARAAGYPVYLTTDPEWLLDVAICRRAGWVEDRHSRHIARPRADGKLPRFATGDAQAHIRQIADRVNARIIVRPQELGEWRSYLEKRMPERLTYPGDE